MIKNKNIKNLKMNEKTPFHNLKNTNNYQINSEMKKNNIKSPVEVNKFYDKKYMSQLNGNQKYKTIVQIGQNNRINNINDLIPKPNNLFINYNYNEVNNKKNSISKEKRNEKNYKTKSLPKNRKRELLVNNNDNTISKSTTNIPKFMNKTINDNNVDNNNNDNDIYNNKTKDNTNKDLSIKEDNKNEEDSENLSKLAEELLSMSDEYDVQLMRNKPINKNDFIGKSKVIFNINNQININSQMVKNLMNTNINIKNVENNEHIPKLQTQLYISPLQKMNLKYDKSKRNKIYNMKNNNKYNYKGKYIDNINTNNDKEKYIKEIKEKRFSKIKTHISSSSILNKKNNNNNSQINTNSEQINAPYQKKDDINEKMLNLNLYLNKSMSNQNHSVKKIYDNYITNNNTNSFIDNNFSGYQDISVNNNRIDNNAYINQNINSNNITNTDNYYTKINEPKSIIKKYMIEGNEQYKFMENKRYDQMKHSNKLINRINNTNFNMNYESNQDYSYEYINNRIRFIKNNKINESFGKKGNIDRINKFNNPQKNIIHKDEFYQILDKSNNQNNNDMNEKISVNSSKKNLKEINIFQNKSQNKNDNNNNIKKDINSIKYIQEKNNSKYFDSENMPINQFMNRDEKNDNLLVKSIKQKKMNYLQNSFYNNYQNKYKNRNILAYQGKNNKENNYLINNNSYINNTALGNPTF